MGRAERGSRPAAVCRCPQLYLQRDQPAGRPAAGADRRAHAARRARGELLVPAPPRRLRVDPRARRGPARRRHGLRRGLRRRRARAAGASVVGVDANPEAHEHARAALHARRTCASSATSSRRSPSPATRSSFLQTIEHVQDPGEVLEHFKRCSRAAAAWSYVSTPNLLTLAPEGAEKSEQPVARQGVPRRGVPRAVRGALRPRRDATACSTRRKLRAHELAIRSAAGTTSTSALGLTKPLLRLVHAGDRGERLRARAGATRRARRRALDFLAVCRP